MAINNYEILRLNNFKCIKSNNNFWFSQKDMANIFGTTTQNITIHIKNIYSIEKAKKDIRNFIINNKEAERIVKRNIKHYGLNTLFNIAINSKRFEKFNKAIREISEKYEIELNFNVSTTKQRNFKSILEKALNGIESFEYQYIVRNYRIDFYFPKLNLAVEYDENHHRFQFIEDMKRQKEIIKLIGCKFIRVYEGKEIEGLNKILIYKLEGKP